MRKFDLENAKRLLRHAAVLGEDAVLPKYLLAIVFLRLGEIEKPFPCLRHPFVLKCGQLLYTRLLALRMPWQKSSAR